ncbi:MAG: alpha/beta hydrolase [Planctomycetia bacterium]|nr:alpha/beta hydrolase [Planctomycetia bacterium]
MRASQFSLTTFFCATFAACRLRAMTALFCILTCVHAGAGALFVSAARAMDEVHAIADGRLASGQEINIHSLDARPLLADGRIWLVIHGNNSGPERMRPLADTLAAATPETQVLLLDWSDAAKSRFGAWAQAENHIDTVAAWVYQSLVDRRIDGSRLNIVGHSFGAYVADRLAARYGRVETLLALDPAIDVPAGFPYGGSSEFDPRTPGLIDFAAHARRSLSFRAATDPLGLNRTALTADECFLVQGVDHSRVVDVVAGMLQLGEFDLFRRYLALDDLDDAATDRPWLRRSITARDELNADGKRVISVTPASSNGEGFDACLLADRQRRIHCLQYLDSQRTVQRLSLAPTGALAENERP